MCVLFSVWLDFFFFVFVGILVVIARSGFLVGGVFSLWVMFLGGGVFLVG